MTDDTLHGEDSIIQEFLAPLAAGFPGAFGLKDDCAVIAPPAGSELVVKTDPIVAGVHFLPDADARRHRLAGAGGQRFGSCRQGREPDRLRDGAGAARGAQARMDVAVCSRAGEAQRAFGCHLIGGDTDRAPGPLTVAITAFGTVPAGRMVRRGHGARGRSDFRHRHARRRGARAWRC